MGLAELPIVDVKVKGGAAFAIRSSDCKKRSSPRGDPSLFNRQNSLSAGVGGYANSK